MHALTCCRQQSPTAGTARHRKGSGVSQLLIQQGHAYTAMLQQQPATVCWSMQRQGSNQLRSQFAMHSSTCYMRHQHATCIHRHATASSPPLTSLFIPQAKSEPVTQLICMHGHAATGSLLTGSSALKAATIQLLSQYGHAYTAMLQPPTADRPRHSTGKE